MTQTHERKKPAARKPKADATAEPKPRKQRTAAQRVADLEAEIARVKQREATKELRRDPAVKLTSAAVRALNKALGEATEEDMVEALTAAKAVLAEHLDGKGLRVPQPGKKRAKPAAA